MTGLPRPRRRSRAKRGSWTHGYGGKKKHRGKGSHGGRGAANLHKHKYSFTVTYDLRHYGYKGFIPPTALPDDVVINLGALEKIAEKLDKKDLNLTELGFTKLLARGDVTIPLNITIAKASARAKQAVEEAGGKLVLDEEPASEEVEAEAEEKEA